MVKNNLIKSLIIERLQRVEIYHGGSFYITDLNKHVDSMYHDNSNNQEGVGIYFGTLKTAEFYGDKIVRTTINPKKFLNSRDEIGKYISASKIEKIIKSLNASNEDFWYMYSDYGIEVSEPKDIRAFHHRMLAELLMDEQVRNFQTNLVAQSSVKSFVDAWKLHSGFYGTYEAEQDFYALIDNDDKIEVYNGK
jgi:hypothetical protein